MAIADELVAVLKVDNSQLLEGLKKAQAGLKEIQLAMKTTAHEEVRFNEAQARTGNATASVAKKTKEASGAFKSFSGVLGGLRSSFLSLRTIMTGFILGAGIARLAESTTKIANLAQVTGQSATSIRALGRVFEEMGFSAGEAESTIQSISDALANARYGGGLSGLLIPMTAFGVNLFDKNGNPREVAAMLLDMGDAVKKVSSNVMEARMRLKSMGFDNASIAFMTDPNARRMLAHQKANAKGFEAQARKAKELNKYMKQLEQTFQDFGLQTLPIILPFVRDFSKGLGELIGLAKQNPQGAKLAIEAIGLAALAAKGKVGLLVAALIGAWEYGKWFFGLLKNGNDVQKAMVSGEFEGNTVDPGMYGLDDESRKKGPPRFRKGNAGKRFMNGIVGFAEEVGESLARVFSFGGADDDRQVPARLVNYFMRKGYSQDDAIAIIANLEAESGFDTNIVGDSGKAYGIAQWHPDRQARFRKVFGKSIRGSTLEEQADFIDWELHNTHRRALQKMLEAQTLDEKTAAITRYYEVPADIAGQSAKRAVSARMYKRELTQSQLLSMANSQNTTTNNSSTNQTIYNNVNVTVPTVRDAQQIASAYTSGQKSSHRMASGMAV